MIFKEAEALHRQAAGMDFEVLAHGKKCMITRFKFKPGQEVTPHSHPHEQAGYIVSGRAMLRIGNKEEVVAEGDSYYVPGGEKHGLVAVNDTIVLDFFTPPREDYL